MATSYHTAGGLGGRGRPVLDAGDLPLARRRLLEQDPLRSLLVAHSLDRPVRTEVADVVDPREGVQQPPQIVQRAQCFSGGRGEAGGGAAAVVAFQGGEERQPGLLR